MPEIFECIAQPWGGLQLPVEGQKESHPADFCFRGRVRVTLKGADGLPINLEVPDRKTLFLKVAELVPEHPGRSPEAMARRAAEEAAARAAAMKAQGGGTSSGGAALPPPQQQRQRQRSSSKKKGRK